MRKSWDEYFLSIARNVAERSTCNRKQVGCVIVRDRAILSTGYAGSMRGQPHCIDVGCEIGPDGGCLRTVHSEINAVALAAKHGTSIDGATAYVTLSPCYNCFKMLVNSGIKRVVFDEEYRIPLDPQMVAKCGVGFEQVSCSKSGVSDPKLEAVKQLILWKCGKSDLAGEDLFGHVFHQLKTMELNKVPEEHRAALGSFRRFGGDFAHSLVCQVLKV